LPKADASAAARENVSFLKEIENALRAKKVVSAAPEAETLALHFSKLNRIDFFTGRRVLTRAQKKRVQKAVAERGKGMPLAYLTGTAGFYGHEFKVGPSVLVPRPETELLVEEVLKVLPPKHPQILELGTGSGCIAVSLTIARADCKMTALDISSEALKTARKNAHFHGVGRRISLFKSDLFDSLSPRYKEGWDVLVSNPPYIPREEYRDLPRDVRREPKRALDGGPKGLVILKKILERGHFFLKDGGFVLLEIGHGQSAELGRLAKKISFYEDISFVRDYAGIDRIFKARKITANG